VPHYSVSALRQHCISRSTRPFLARGATLTRCENCQLGVRWCICQYREAVAQRQLQTRADFCLLMHRHETMKPTNTGRLIADVLPQNTHAYLWDRTEPDPLLLEFLNARAGNLWILFPENYCIASAEDIAGNINAANRRPRCVVPIENITAECAHPTFILLDGTWKQARKMFHMSEWMWHIPVVQLTINADCNYRLRQGSHDMQVSTLEAAAGLLEASGDAPVACVMRDYFDTFNEYYAASRGSRRPEQQPSMQRLLPGS
jgi:DTW domain-containing protein YfiP